MISCLIIDDEEKGRNNLNAIVRSNCPELNVLAQAKSVSEAVKLIHELKPQLLFLDIQMNDGTGFDVLSKCQDETFEVIFVTAFNQYGIHAIKFSAIDYLLKPIDKAQLVIAVNKASEQINLRTENQRLKNLLQNRNLNDQNKRIALPFVDSIEFVEVKDIIRLEADGSYTIFRFTNGEKLLVSGSLKEYDEMLSAYGFIRTHQAHLVNPAYIKSMIKSDGGYLKLKNDETVPISRLRKVDVLKNLKEN